MTIEITECEQEEYLIAPFAFKDSDIQKLFVYIKEMWGIEQCRAGVGSYISLEKVKNKNFQEYDGLFTPSLSNNKNIFIKPKGKYLCGYIKGSWDNLPKMYEKMLKYTYEQVLASQAEQIETKSNNLDNLSSFGKLLGKEFENINKDNNLKAI